MMSIHATRAGELVAGDQILWSSGAGPVHLEPVTVIATTGSGGSSRVHVGTMPLDPDQAVVIVRRSHAGDTGVYLEPGDPARVVADRL